MPTTQEIIAAITAGAIGAALMAGGVALYQGEPRAIVVNAVRDGGIRPLRTESLCDGIDNDNDGDTDEGFRIGDGCQFAVGDCASRMYEPSDGLIVCADDQVHSVCIRNTDVAVLRAPSNEVCCDRRDNDCDGTTDEDCECPGVIR